MEPSSEGEPRHDVVIITDASVEGEEATSVLRARGFVVVDVPLGLLEAHFATDPPRVLILDVDQPKAIETCRRLRNTTGGSRMQLLCVGDPLRAAELFVDGPASRASLEDVFERPVDVQRLADRVGALATPSGISYSTRGTTPPPMYAPRASLPPPSESLPPISEFPRAVDPLDAGLLSLEDGDAIGPAVVLSPDLAEILARAERRVANSVDRLPSAPGVADDPDCPLPADMLAPLDEPLDPLEEELGTGSGSVSEGTGSAQVAAWIEGAGNQPGSTGAGTSSGTGSSVLVGISPAAITTTGIPVGISSVGARSPILPASMGSSTTASSSAPVASASSGGAASASSSGAGSAFGAPALSQSIYGSIQESSVTPQAGWPQGFPTLPQALPQTAPTSVREGTGTSTTSALKLSELGQPARAPTSAARLDLAAPVETAAAPVRFQEARVFGEGRASMALAFEEQLHARGDRAAERGDRAADALRKDTRKETTNAEGPIVRRDEPRAPIADVRRASPPRPTTDTGRGARDSGSAMPAVFAEMEGGKPLARAVAARFSGSLAFNASGGVRRIVLQDGDMVTAGSEIADESLVSFLASRGDIDRDAAGKLAGRLPPSGRHAGAALIAQGYLAQDDLWPVLRAHAEWLIGRAIVAGPGTVEPEDEPPGRLRAEPGVFGGATGAEIFVEMMRRVVPAGFALAQLGGPSAVFENGARQNLLGESALPDAEQAIARTASGRTVGELCADTDGDLATVLWALVELGVLGVLAPARPSRSERERATPDPLDDEAIRQRVRARLALVREGDYFSLLGVHRTATSYEVKRAYLELRRTFEPSRLLTAATIDLAEDVALVAEVLDEAYEILRDENRRERYRRAIDATPGD